MSRAKPIRAPPLLMNSISRALIRSLAKEPPAHHHHQGHSVTIKQNKRRHCTTNSIRNEFSSGDVMLHLTLSCHPPANKTGGRRAVGASVACLISLVQPLRRKD